MTDEPNVKIWLGEQKRVESSAECRARNVTRDGADVTYGGRACAVPHQSASNRKCSAANSRMVNRRLDEAFAAGRAKSSATWRVSNV